MTDPVLRHRLLHLRRRKTHIDPAWYQNLDSVLISHAHWDHLDIPSLRLLSKYVHIIVPGGMGSFLRRHGFHRVQELSIGGKTALGSLEIQATYALHESRHNRFARPAECLGYVISGSSRIYFAGDTDLFPEMANLAVGLDVALLPVWGWGPRLGSGHMDPYRAAQALKLLKPRLAVPIHWGTLHPLGLTWMGRRFLYKPPHDFVRYAAHTAPKVDVRILAPGSALTLENSSLKSKGKT